MNITLLQKAEERFFSMYPLGFETPELLDVLKKHKIQRMNSVAQEALSKENLQENPDAINDIVKIISRSSIVSVFEKTKFRNLIKEMDSEFHHECINAIYQMIHENEQNGFEQLVSLLSPFKIAKWPVVTVLLAYYRPTKDIFIKPTTVKKVITTFELKDIKYSPKVNYEFYDKYRFYINQMKTYVDPRIHITNGHFSGFLMMSL